MMNDWKETMHMDYYYRTSDGRILGAVWQYSMNSAIWASKIYSEEFPFTNASEKFLGNFISKITAKSSVENYWLQQLNTLEYSNESGD